MHMAGYGIAIVFPCELIEVRALKMTLKIKGSECQTCFGIYL